MSKYITGLKIINDLGLHDFEFYNDYLRQGLTPLNQHGLPFSPHDAMAQMFNIPGQQEVLFQLNDSLHDLDDESAASTRFNRIIPMQQAMEQCEARLASCEEIGWGDFGLPHALNEAQYILGLIKSSLFDKAEVLQIVGGETYVQQPEDANLHADEEEPAVAAKPKRVHHTVKDKMRVQAKAQELLDGEYKGYNAPDLAITPEIRDAATKKSGGPYSKRKRVQWINEILPDDQVLRGAPKQTDE